MTSENVGLPFPSRPTAYYALAMLMLACLFSYIDKSLLNLLVQPIEHDLKITDTQMALLQGFTFSVFYSVMGLPLGWVADHKNRRNLIAGGIALWSLATVCSGLVNSFPQLLVARVCVSVGEAALMPAAYSLLSDYFPPTQRGRAFGVFTLMTLVGGGGALLIGGVLLRALKGHASVALPLIGNTVVWKAAFMVVGAPGVLIVLLMLLVHEPVRRKVGLKLADAAVSEKVNRTLVRYMAARPLAFFSILGCYSLMSFTSYTTSPWAPTLLVRKFELAAGTAGMAIGASALFAGAIGCVIGGALGDRWTANGAIGGRFRLTLVWWILCLPFLAGFCLIPSPVMAVTSYAVFLVIHGIGYVTAMATIQDISPSALRGRGTAVMSLVNGFVGQGGGPLATALVTDHVFHSQAALPYSILTVATPAVAAGLMLSLIGLKAFDRARAEAIAGA